MKKNSKSAMAEDERRKKKRRTRRNSRAQDVLKEGFFQLRSDERKRAESVASVEVLISVVEEKF